MPRASWNCLLVNIVTVFFFSFSFCLFVRDSLLAFFISLILLSRNDAEKLSRGRRLWNCDMFLDPVADPETSERGARNMKYKPPHAAAIYFWPIFYRPERGAWPLWPPKDPLLKPPRSMAIFFITIYLQARGHGPTGCYWGLVYRCRSVHSGDTASPVKIHSDWRVLDACVH